MNLTIAPAGLAGSITPPPSKSQAHRLIIAAALAQGRSVLSNVAASQDVEATLGCMEQLGAEHVCSGGELTVQGMGAGAMSPLRRMAFPRLDCGESGSTLRFLIPVALAVRGGGIFSGRGRLMERPQEPYFRLFHEKGISYEREGGKLTVQGLLAPGRYALPGGVSSQFATGLLFALPLLDGDSEIVLTSALESRGYVDMTLAVLEGAGIQVEEREDGFFVPGGQRYRPRSLAVEADWSQAAFWYAANFVGCQVTLEGLNFDSAQGDKQAAALYWPMARPGDLDIDLAHIPDLAPPLAAMAAVRRGVTRFVHAGRLRLKESDRIAAITDALNALGAQAEETPDGFVVHGLPQLEGGGTVDCRNDHRIAMMAGVLACCAQRPSTLLGAECVEKSYPQFWAEFARLGGDSHVLALG